MLSWVSPYTDRRGPAGLELVPVFDGQGSGVLLVLRYTGAVHYLTDNLTTITWAPWIRSLTATITRSPRVVVAERPREEVRSGTTCINPLLDFRIEAFSTKTSTSVLHSFFHLNLLPDLLGLLIKSLCLLFHCRVRVISLLIKRY